VNVVGRPDTEHSRSLVARIAAAAKTSEDVVVEVFTTYGIPLAYPPARPRPVRVHKLRIQGVRAGTQHDGSFDHTYTFSSAFTALVASNFRGKTSILEIITWCLRGSPRDRLQADVRRWLSRVELDATIAGQAVGFRLTLDNGVLTRGLILAASQIGGLPAQDDGVRPPGVSTLVDATGEDDFAAQVAALMLDRLDLQPLVNKLSKDNEVGIQTHGWPAYFSTMYLPAGPDKPLLGDQSMAGLPGRLLQVFLDLPAAAVLTRVKATRDVLRAGANRQAERDSASAEQRAGDRARAQEALNRAQDLLDQISDQPPGTSLIELADAATRLAHEVADAEEEWDQSNRVYRAARRQRQADEKMLNDLQESEIARLLFHGLDPSTCPRCEAPITDERRQQERNVHRCAVCTADVVGETANDEEVETDARARVEASRSAEDVARQAMESAELMLSRLTSQLHEAQQLLRGADISDSVREHMKAELEVARWKGALEMVPELGEQKAGPESAALKVLTAADKVLNQESKDSAAALFAELNTEIADIAKRFGIDALEDVEIDRAAHLKVVKGGGAQSPFIKQSPGEQVRLRIAVVIALLRVGARHGISTHPGFFLIDSPKAEEVQDLDAAILFKELAKLATNDNIQVLITTADFKLSNDVLPRDSVVAAEEGAPLW